MRESAYQAGLIRRIRSRFPGCVVLKNDASYRQGVPDLIVLYGPRWGMLEVKGRANFRSEPNQDWYVDTLDEMSFAAYIHPSNEDEVLNALQRSLHS